MEVRYSMENIDTDKKIVFLAGPTMRVSDDFDGLENQKSWRNEAIKMFEKLCNTIESDDLCLLIPEFRDNQKPKGWSYGGQIDWELMGLEKADVILFWIPRNLETLPGFTTNIEFGEWMKSGKIVIGAPPESPKNDYIKYRCELLGIPFEHHLTLTVFSAWNYITE